MLVFRFRNLLQSRYKIIPGITKAMDLIKRSEEIKLLFQHLKTAQDQADALINNINDIKAKIKEISANEIFKKHISETESLQQSTKEIDLTDGDLDYVEEPPTKKSKHNFIYDSDYVVVYTDGACENNGKANARAGIGVWFGDNHPLNRSRPVVGKATNNVAEIQACINALEIARSESIFKIKILTDSQFTINCVTKWIHKWQKNNWKLANGGDVKNKGELVKLVTLTRSRDVKYEYVAGHAGVKGNEEADRLAREGAKSYNIHSA